jgi:hypothetical protein
MTESVRGPAAPGSQGRSHGTGLGGHLGMAPTGPTRRRGRLVQTGFSPPGSRQKRLCVHNDRTSVQGSGQALAVAPGGTYGRTRPTWQELHG